MAKYVKICNCGKEITLASDDSSVEITASYSQVGDKLYIICPGCRTAAEVPPDMFPYKGRSN